MSLSDGDKAWLQAFFTDITNRFNQVEGQVGETNLLVLNQGGEIAKLTQVIERLRGDLAAHVGRLGHRDDRDEATITEAVRRAQSIER